MEAERGPKDRSRRRGFQDYLRRRLWLARAALVWEQLWPALWPAVLVAGSAVAVALFDLLPRLPGWLHGLVLAAFAVAFLVAVWRAAASLTSPDANAARRRLERASGLVHRPLTVLDDRPATGTDDAVARALWQVHRERVAAALARLKVGVPAAGLARRDPLALRAVLVVALILAVIDAGGEAASRLARAMEPDIHGFRGPAAAVNAWIAPPEYTGRAPIVLAPVAGSGTGAPAPDRSAGETDGTISVPAASTLLARVNGGRGVPALTIGGEAAAFTAVEPDSYKASAVIETDGRVAVRQSHRQLGAWDLAVVADMAPRVEITRPPSATDRGALRVDYRVQDDYGVAAVKALIRRPEGGVRGARPRTEGGTVREGGIEIALPSPGSLAKPAEATSYHDLTAHPWAGLEVTLWLEASDGIAQTGRSEALDVTLPERVFRHPVARAIVAERKRLGRKPGARRDVARKLARIAEAPERYGHDVVVYLALRTAAARLLLDATGNGTAKVQMLLWDTALRIEDGSLPLAERDLREIERALLEALAEGAGEEEIERLLNELEQAMDRYLDALARSGEEARRKLGERHLIDPSARAVRRDDLHGLLERARELARTGDREAARALLSRLQDILENLRLARPDSSSQATAARESMEGLRDLVERQHDLLDRTFRRARGGPAPEPGQPRQRRDQAADARAAAEQEALRRDLGELMLSLGDMLGRIPRPLGRAERAMRDAAKALERGSPRQAVPLQGRALDQLQQGAQAAGEALMRQLQAQAGGIPVPGAPPGEIGHGRDPLGRPLPDHRGWDTGTVRIPDQMELQRAREILDELRRRASEPHRPRLEKDYLDRLLPGF
jgi:uncharacterized protein (TIGR02302 family)